MTTATRAKPKANPALRRKATTASRKPAADRYTKAQYLRDVIALYQQHHPAPFATADVATWSVARGLQPVPDTDESRRRRIDQARARQGLSTTTPAGIRAYDADHAAAELQKRIDAWRADWLRYLLGLCAQEDYKLALRLLLSALSTGRTDLPTVDAALASIGADPADPLATTARVDNPIEPLMELGIVLVWSEGAPVRWFGAAEIETLAQAAGLYLAAHWKANLAGPLTEQLFELLPLDQLNAYALDVKLPDTSLKTRTTKPDLVAALIAYPRTRDLLPPCIKPVTLDPPHRKGAKRK